MAGPVGSWFLAGGLVLALVSALLWLRVALSQRSNRVARWATGATGVAALGACGALEWALIGHDFSVGYVAENGGRDVPLYFTITSLWAALDGSLLLWSLILCGCAVVLLRGYDEWRPWVLTVISVVLVFFFALTYFAANPFQPVRPVPDDGPGPNPLLQEHPAMGIHPPMLYLGYIGLVIPFAYALAALFTGIAGPSWIGAVRRWTLISWSFLTGGVLLGAWWSYAVLGWGGYWAWDPVENASLLPWLTATAALHSILVRRRGNGLTGWTITLSCTGFLLVLVGTFLTRSGAVESVHSFTASPLGPLLLGFVVLVTAVVLAAVAWRSALFASTGRPAPLLSRESAVLANAVVFVLLATIVLIGTLFPLIADVFAGHRVSVGAGYFERSAVPVALVMLALMGAGPLVRSGGETAARLGRRLSLPAAAGLAVVGVVGLVSRPGVPALLCFGLAAFVLTASVARLTEVGASRRTAGGLLAHVGIAVAAIGIAASSAYTASAERELSVGESITVAGRTATLAGIDRSDTAGRMAATARLELAAGDVVRPKLQYYRGRDMTVAVPGIHSGVFADDYATVTRIAEDGTAATVRYAVNPMVGLLWAGGAMVVVGGLLAASWRRRRAATDEPARAEVAT